ncbi:Putative transporter C83,11 OS=Schizosaccharomyces pombe (strain 972 / ATCC 24843) GN=SPBC83.11 PE=1 SV=2 [Rhizoctonia solani AG-1 IB]|uniref:Putative transporter C83,11 n=1 Tax=Thanatephorus cucumeris (strain AG1-IB / isolate 7/3/14) TaxID=1108050 RepID=A0A0B7FYT1_THACB|nr:Putative transporter C83,11 OS=Schizosaccharomyces pombe (strain 972 / ATCC 24843) GN=SPBC83.11 PE=1 SV=2 [Rhizoctonia solani AG-1 IB]
MAGTLTEGRLRSGSVHTHGQARPHAGWMMDKPRTENGYLPSPANMNTHRSFLSSASSTLGSLSVPKPNIHAAPSLTQATPSVSTLRFIGLCSLWYLTSALSSNTGKSIMMQFRYPVTLTFVQFAFVSGYCLLFMHPRFGMSSLRSPTRAIIRSTLPMAAFQVGGHIFSSMAISRVPVSTVHTIKALSPLFTVAAYRLLFGVSYSFRTYISLLPLTIGVMLACTFDVAGSNLIGLMCAFGSALVFVSSNIFFKKIMPSNGAATAHKLDKLNLLFYSSGLAFLLMVPIWMYYDFGHLWRHWHDDSLASSSSAKAPAHSVMYYFFLNGTVHWVQNIIAFAILATTSPVTYSIASLIKRVAVICIAIVWFAQNVHPVQGLGIILTFVGLWMYNQAKGDVERGEHKARRVEAGRQLQLPTSKSELITPQGSPHPQHAQILEHGSGVQVHPYAPPTRSHPPMRQMSINTAAATVGKQTNSPTGSYPSPPASLDSPPQSAGIRLKNRRGTHDEHNLGLEPHQTPTPQPHSQF